MKILVVEDDPFVRKLILSVLGRLGHGLESVDCAEEALKKISQDGFDLYICDINLPGLSGLDLLDRIRPRDNECEAVMITGAGDADSIRQSLKLGAFDFLQKPFSVDTLTQCVERALEKAGQKIGKKERLHELEHSVKEKDDQVRLLSLISESEREKANIVFDTLTEGLVVLDTQNLVVLINRAAGRIFGADPKKCMENPVETVLPALAGEIPPKICLNDRIYEVSGYPIASSAGRLGTTLLINDITAAENTAVLRNNLLSIVAHELRTPLTAILVHLYLLQKAAASQYGPMLVPMKEAADSLNRLVDAMIKVAVYSDPGVPVKRGRISVADLFRRMVDRLKMEINNKQVKVRFDAETGASLVSDADKLSFALECLLSNAVKFNRPGGEIVLAHRRRNGGHAISVQDHGPGIPADKIPGIYQAFTQAEDHMRREHGGLGVGLFLVRRIMDLLSGKVDVEGSPEKGTTATLWLPEKVKVVT